MIVFISKMSFLQYLRIYYESLLVALHLIYYLGKPSVLPIL